MCLSAIIWSNIKDIYFCNTKKDAAKIGFRDDAIYEFIKGHSKVINLHHIDSDEALEVFKNFENDSKKVMY